MEKGKAFVATYSRCCENQLSDEYWSYMLLSRQEVAIRRILGMPWFEKYKGSRD